MELLDYRCPICEQVGKVTSETDMSPIPVEDTCKHYVLLHYKRCGYCGEEFADKEDVGRNCENHRQEIKRFYAEKRGS